MALILACIFIQAWQSSSCQEVGRHAYVHLD
jgi:hypothetical protein